VDIKVTEETRIKDWTKKLRIFNKLHCYTNSYIICAPDLAADKKAFNIKWACFLTAALMATACTHKTPQVAANTNTKNNGNEPKAWSASMQDLKTSISNLLPIAASHESFENPKNHQMIEEQLSVLSKEASTIGKHATMAGRDPSVRYLSNAFTEDVKRIETSFKVGKKEFARYHVVNLTSYCIECHTRDSTGPNFGSEKLTSALQKLKPMERAEYELATRQYDLALEELKKIISSNLDDKGNLFLVDKSMKLALAVTVKYQQSPDKALEVVSILEKSKNTPYFLKQNAVAWRASLESWKKEKVNTKDSVAAKLSRIEAKLAKASQMDSLTTDRSGDITYLRSLAELHTLLGGNLKKEEVGRTMYLIGVSYEAIRELEFLNLSENYFEGCIRTLPRTDWSSKCFKKYEESIYFGYSGSSGVQIPIDEQLKLKELQSLALPVQ
jgi:hypothetical protein